MLVEMPKLTDKFLLHGVQMLVDGLEHDVIKDNLSREIFYTRHNQQKVSSAFRTMATVAPIFGLLGTLMGIVALFIVWQFTAFFLKLRKNRAEPAGDEAPAKTSEAGV